MAFQASTWRRWLTVGWLLIPISIYRYALSPLLGRNCRYSPSCSQYCVEALVRHDLFVGGWLGIKRLLRCHPWGGSGFDPVPDCDCASITLNFERH